MVILSNFGTQGARTARQGLGTISGHVSGYQHGPFGDSMLKFAKQQDQTTNKDRHENRDGNRDGKGGVGGVIIWVHNRCMYSLNSLIMARRIIVLEAKAVDFEVGAIARELCPNRILGTLAPKSTLPRQRKSPPRHPSLLCSGACGVCVCHGPGRGPHPLVRDPCLCLRRCRNL